MSSYDEDINKLKYVSLDGVTNPPLKGEKRAVLYIGMELGTLHSFFAENIQFSPRLVQCSTKLL